MALNGSFTIYYFIGNFTEDNARDYALQPTMAGLNHVFTSTREACDNCGDQMDEGHLVTDTNPITPMLLDYIEIGQLADLTPANVVPFLIKNLKWRVVTVCLRNALSFVDSFVVASSRALADVIDATGHWSAGQSTSSCRLESWCLVEVDT